ncbi:hypothetical protein [Bifidobacterium canis]|uniref:Uncharacterized protein n=1 Tax=Bifidobacterium canis TaxID=2610880 RepID=A0A7K1J3N3_9BIFI|nr:hypothetical protein [Bifidobacterium canis]MUH59247.1 hypothetical protein [Bifidobacterium canis]
MSQPAQHPRTAGPRVQPLIVSAAVISLVLGFDYDSEFDTKTTWTMA